MNELVKSFKIDTNEAIERLKAAEQFAEYIAKSEAYAAPFKTAVKNDEGVVTEYIVNKHDVIACITIGIECGIPPMVALSMGKAMNYQAYRKVEKGRAFGLSAMESINAISIIPTSNGDVIHTGYQVITNGLLLKGIKFEFVEDSVKLFGLRELSADAKLSRLGIIAKQGDDEYDTILNSPLFFLKLPATPMTEVADAIRAKRRIITKEVVDVRTTCMFYRDGYAPLKISYSLQEATDAGLFRGYHSSLVDEHNNPIWVEGKSNWNNHPLTILRGRVLSIGGRIIGADIMSNVYSTDEALEFTDLKPKPEMEIGFNLDNKVDTQEQTAEEV